MVVYVLVEVPNEDCRLVIVLNAKDEGEARTEAFKAVLGDGRLAKFSEDAVRELTQVLKLVHTLTLGEEAT